MLLFFEVASLFERRCLLFFYCLWLYAETDGDCRLVFCLLAFRISLLI